MVAILQHGGKIALHAEHAPRSDRLDARLLDGVEHGLGVLGVRRELPVQRHVVAGKPQREAVRMAAQHRRILGAELPRRFGQARLCARPLADQHRLVGCEGHLDIRGAGESAQAPGNGALQRLGRRRGGLAGLAVGNAHRSIGTGRSMAALQS